MGEIERSARWAKSALNSFQKSENYSMFFVDEEGTASSFQGIKQVIEARGRSECMFRTHQDRLPKELEAAGITCMAAANEYIQQVYMPTFNAEFMQPAMEEGSAFLPYAGRDLSDILCEQHERVVGNDNCVSFEGIKLQIPKDRARLHYVMVKVRVHCYPDGHLAIFHWSALPGAFYCERCLYRAKNEGRGVSPPRRPPGLLKADML